MPEGSSRHDTAGTARGESLACVTCRSRKLKCDRTKPSCARCRRDGIECVYPESRRKPPFRREHVKHLEARLGNSSSHIVGSIFCVLQLELAQVERALRQAEANVVAIEASDNTGNPSNQPPPQSCDISLENNLPENETNPDISENFGQTFTFSDYVSQDHGFTENGELIGLGYSESPPPHEIQEELYVPSFLIQFLHHL